MICVYGLPVHQEGDQYQQEQKGSCILNKKLNMSDYNMKFKTLEEVKSYASKTEKTLLILDDYVLDVSTFQCHHPGGGYLLKNKNLQKVDEQMKFHHPLSLRMANSMIIGSFKKEISRFIDPQQPLMPQVWNLDRQQYLKLINSPHWLFVPTPRMFETDFMEFFSLLKWWHILPLPAVLFSYLIYRIDSWDNFNLGLSLLASLCGFLLWTLVEYVLHRFVFHSQYWLPDSKAIRYAHFALHGIHHMLPNDPQRLVHPPILVVIELNLLFPLAVKIIPISDPIIFAFFWIAFGIGYLCYDLMHYSLHHIDTSNSKGGWFHKLQQYHNQHHFGGQEAGFGVSSPLWDYIIGTGYTKNKKNQ